MSLLLSDSQLSPVQHCTENIVPDLWVRSLSSSASSQVFLKWPKQQTPPQGPPVLCHIITYVQECTQHTILLLFLFHSIHNNILHHSAAVQMSYKMQCTKYQQNVLSTMQSKPRYGPDIHIIINNDDELQKPTFVKR